MTTQNIGYVRGFDLFFFGASEATLKSIAEHLGGDSNYQFDEGFVTYMCEQTHAIHTSSQLNHIQEVVSSVGNYFSQTYCHPYLYAELRVSTTKNGLTLKKIRVF
jgi:hypothetical protein